MRRARGRQAALALAGLCWVSVARAQDPGVYRSRIVFGQSAALTGTVSNLGLEFSLGIRAAFREVNAAGGVHRRKLQLDSLDDAYEPELAIANTRKLIEDRKVFALIGVVGTPTSRAALPVAAEKSVPYIAPFSGAAFLREGRWTNVVNLRASYDQETEEIASYLTRDLGIQRIGILYQDDSFGRAGLSGVRQALERRGMRPVATGSYVRHTTAVKTALLDLRASNPGALVLVGAYEPVATFIKWSRFVGFNPVFVTISFVGSAALAHELGPAGDGVRVTQVVPVPDSDLPVVKAYRAALEAEDSQAKPSFVSLEGYLAGRLAITGLRRAGPEPTRASFVSRLSSAESIDLDGFALRFGAGDNQGSDAVFITRIDSRGRYQPVRTSSGARQP